MKNMMARVLSLALTGAFFLMGSAAAESVFTQEMVLRGLVGVGNTERLHRAIDKAKAGGEVSIVCLGGSITEGALAKPQQTACYAGLAAQHFADRFMPDPAKLQCHNAGISGTPSLLGITRCARDVLAHAPDIVFVEFAVNDGTDADSRMAYESLVRKLLLSGTQPAVVLIFTVMENGYTAQTHMQQIGRHYGLGMLSVGDAIMPAIKAGEMTWRDYSEDYTHPNTQGHAFIAQMIDHYYEQAAATPAQARAVPDFPVYAKDLQNLVNLQPGDERITAVGSFPYGMVTCYSYRAGWRHTGAMLGSAPLTLRIPGKVMTLAFKQEKRDTCGTAEVYVDGTLRASLSGQADNAWGNVITQLIRLGGAGEHTVEIRMAPGDEGKDFNLLDVGYVNE